MHPLTPGLLEAIADTIGEPVAVREAKHSSAWAAKVQAAIGRYTGLRIAGGKGDLKSPKDLPFDALCDGVKVELEHTPDIDMALEIAVDHLSEREDYYTVLAASGLADELKVKESLFHTTVQKHMNRYLAAQQTSAETASKSGYSLNVHYPLKNVPEFDHRTVEKSLNDLHAQRLAQHHNALARHRAVPRILANHHHALMAKYEDQLRRHDQHPTLYPHPGPVPGVKDVNSVPLHELSAEDASVIKEAQRVGYAKPGPVPTRYTLADVPAHVLPAHARAEVLKARDAHSALLAHHEKLSLLAAHYSGASVPAADLKYIPKDDPRYHAAPHWGDAYRGKPDHLSTFKFKSRADAYRMLTSLRTAGHGFRKADVTDNDSGLQVMHTTPSKLTTEAKMGHGPGALRNAKGHFASWHDKQWTRWVPHLPKDFRSKVESLGGKVRPSGNGGGLALVFKTHDDAKKAHAVLAQEGHRINPHDIPGVLLVSFVKPSAVVAEAAPAAALHGAGWGFANACALLDAGQDPRKADMAQVCADAVRDLDDTLDAIDNQLGENFNQSFDDLSDAKEAAQEMANLLDLPVVVVRSDGEYTVVPLDGADDGDEADMDAEAVVYPEEDDVDEGVAGVAKRHRLAARLSAGRIRGRPMGGKRLRSAMRAKRWRLRNRSKHLLNKKTTVYRNAAPIHPTK